MSQRKSPPDSWDSARPTAGGEVRIVATKLDPAVHIAQCVHLRGACRLRNWTLLITPILLRRGAFFADQLDQGPARFMNQTRTNSIRGSRR